MAKISILLSCIILLLHSPVMAQDVPTMTADELKSQLEQVVILDVRTSRDWSDSDTKIKGAFRIDNSDLSQISLYPEETTFVLYCA